MDRIHSSTVHHDPIRLRSYIPEPKGPDRFNFNRIMDRVGSLVAGGSLPKTAAAIVDPSYQDILSKQIELQQQMMLVSLNSNLERTRHEINMAPIRNMRIA